MVMRSVRRWRGITAVVSGASAGLLELPGASRYVVSMLVGDPVRAVWRSDSGSKSAVRIAGDIDILSPGDSVSVEHDRPTELLSVMLSSDAIRSAASSVGENAETLAIGSRTQVRDPRLRHVAWALMEELASSDQDNLGELLGRALAIRLVTTYANTPNDTHGRPRKVGLDSVFEYIDEHLDSDLTLVELARAGCVSVDNLKRLFRDSVGVSAHRYVVQRRVAYAELLLKNGKWALKEVALRSGFSDQSHMTRWMRRMTGMTPTGVRAS